MITETLPDVGISTSVVQDAIGDAGNNIGALCTKSNINPWSFYKPFNFAAPAIGQHYSELDIPLYWANDGFNIPEQNGSITDINDIATYAWTYADRTGGPMYPYRIGDFRCYEHSNTPKSKNWFNMTYSDGTREKTTDYDKTIDLQFNKSGLVDLISKFRYFNSKLYKDTLSDDYDEFKERFNSQYLPASGYSIADFGFLVVEKPVEGHLHLFYKVASVDTELQNASLSIKIPAPTDSDYTLVPNDTHYYIYPAFLYTTGLSGDTLPTTGKFTQVNEEDTSGSWYIFPVEDDYVCKLHVLSGTLDDNESEVVNTVEIGSVVFMHNGGWASDGVTLQDIQKISCTVENINTENTYSVSISLRYKYNGGDIGSMSTGELMPSDGTDDQTDNKTELVFYAAKDGEGSGISHTFNTTEIYEELEWQITYYNCIYNENLGQWDHSEIYSTGYQEVPSAEIVEGIYNDATEK